MGELVFERVTVRYGSGRKATTAADCVSLAVPSAKVVGLVGESGSGKSSLARAAIDVESVAAGRVLLDGQPLRKRYKRQSPPVQMVFQNPYASLDPRMRISASIVEAMPRSVRRDRNARAEEVARLLESVNLEPYHGDHLPGQLSGGQRQRVALARALASRPAVIIADEITSALDVSVQGAVLNLVRRLQRDMGLTMLFISHNLAVVRYVSDYVAVMYSGRIVESGPTEELLADPQHPYTRMLVAAVQRTESSSDGLAVLDSVDLYPGEGETAAGGCRFQSRCPEGPHVQPGRDICRELDPQPTCDTRRNNASCHFAPIGTSR